MKRFWILVVLLPLLAGCGGEERSGEKTAQPGALKVGMVFDIGGKGDRSFNDSAYRGLEKAVSDFGVKAVEFEPGQDSDREQ